MVNQLLNKDILQHLLTPNFIDIEDIPSLRLVCKKWKNVIDEHQAQNLDIFKHFVENYDLVDGYDIFNVNSYLYKQCKYHNSRNPNNSFNSYCEFKFEVMKNFKMFSQLKIYQVPYIYSALSSNIKHLGTAINRAIIADNDVIREQLKHALFKILTKGARDDWCLFPKINKESGVIDASFVTLVHFVKTGSLAGSLMCIYLWINEFPRSKMVMWHPLHPTGMKIPNSALEQMINFDYTVFKWGDIMIKDLNETLEKDAVASTPRWMLMTQPIENKLQSSRDNNSQSMPYYTPEEVKEYVNTWFDFYESVVEQS